MKIRSGFVSNSSSSSFILFVPKTDNTLNSITDFCDLLKNEYYYDDDEAQNVVASYKETLQEQFGLGMGCVLEHIEQGGEGDIERVVEKLGGTIQWMNN